MAPKTSDAANDKKLPASEQGRIDPLVLGVLVCPKTRTPLVYDETSQELISKKAKLAYPIRGGVPVLLIEEARPL